MRTMAYRPKFDPSGAFVARRTFRFNGHTFETGASFDPRYQTRRAQQLYERRLIEYAPGDPRAYARPQAPTRAQADARREAAVPVDQLPDGVGLVADVPPYLARDLPADVTSLETVAVEPLRIEHSGGGWYDVLDGDGNKVNDAGLRRVDAEKLAWRTT